MPLAANQPLCLPSLPNFKTTYSLSQPPDAVLARSLVRPTVPWPHSALSFLKQCPGRCLLPERPPPVNPRSLSALRPCCPLAQCSACETGVILFTAVLHQAQRT